MFTLVADSQHISWGFLKIKYIIIGDRRVTLQHISSSFCVHKNKDSITYFIH